MMLIQFKGQRLGEGLGVRGLVGSVCALALIQRVRIVRLPPPLMCVPRGKFNITFFIEKCNAVATLQKRYIVVL